MTERAGVAENLSPGGVSPWNFLIPFMTDFRSWACTEISWMLKHDSMRWLMPPSTLLGGVSLENNLESGVWDLES